MALRFTLVSEGSSDRALLPILRWLLIDNGIDQPIQEEWADLRRLPNPPRNLAERIRYASELYPCDLLFIHRDGDKFSYDQRREEIQMAINRIPPPLRPPYVCVIPIRMQEAWLLIEEQAIRHAAGNPNGKVALQLPLIKNIETDPNPKQTLYNLLEQASELSGRRLKQFRAQQKTFQIALTISNFSVLRNLSAFQRLENELQSFVCSNRNWIAVL